MGFDFALAAIDTKQASEEGRWMNVRQLDNSFLLNALGNPIRLLFAGTDSMVYRAAQRAMVRERMDQAAADKEANFTPDDREIARRVDEGTNKMIAACLLGWDGILDSNGEPLTFAREGADQLIDGYPIVAAQADNFISARANFTKASSTT